MKHPSIMARAYQPYMVDVRRHLHRHPELSGEEYQTLAFIKSQLEERGIPYTEYENGGLCALLGKGEEAIGIRADVDALPVQEETGLPYASCRPGVMHACGHDVHTAILLGAARLFRDMEDELPCPVKLFFQPAEETVGGARAMVEGGCMENPRVKKVLALHVNPALPVGHVAFLPGKMNAAVIEMDVTVEGKGCHGAHPEMGTDAILAAAHIICALQAIPSRFTAPLTPVVITIGQVQGGTGRNIVAGSVQLTGTIRVLDAETAARVKGQVEQVCRATAAAFGAQARVQLRDDYPALINDIAYTNKMAETARELLGSDHVFLYDTPSMGADDFAYFTQAAPGCYFNIGTAAEGAPVHALHSGHFAPEEGCMETGLALLAAAVMNKREISP